MVESRPLRMAQLPVPPHPMLVVGDIMCDHYVWGEVERISPEAPVQVLRWEREADKPGGAANAAMNLAALGCRVHLAGIVGTDAPGRRLLKILGDNGIDTRGIVQSARRPTTLKTRVMARGHHLLRIDRESRDPVGAADERRLAAAIAKLKGHVSGIVCSDYSKGVLSRRVLRAALGGRRHPFSVVDPKGRDFARYRGADLLTPNERELMDAAGDGDPRVHEDDVVIRRAESVMKTLGFDALLVTRGARGMDLFERRQGAIGRTHIPASQRHEVFDVTGAGDTVAAVLAMGVSSGLPLIEAARLANAAAGIVVGMIGTAVAESETLANIIGGASSQASAKVLSRSALAGRVRDARAQGATIVFTSGAFDAIDVPLLRSLQRARAEGDLLIVGVNGSAGSHHAEMLAALRFVDYVTVITEGTPARLIRELKPDIVI